MSFYADFSTARATPPDLIALAAAVRTGTNDATAVLSKVGSAWRAKKAAAWSAGDLTAVQNALDTTAELTPQLAAQREVDALSASALLAIFLAILDEVNVIRTELNTIRAKLAPPLTPALPMRTEAQFRAAARAKAGTL